MNETGADIDVDEVARAVEGCAAVVRLVAGVGVEVATYLPGRRVPGVRVQGDTVEIRVVARYGQALPEVADEVRRSLVALVGRRQIAVFIDDLDLDSAPPVDAGLSP